jgi:hypothetical protein
MYTSDSNDNSNQLHIVMFVFSIVCISLIPNKILSYCKIENKKTSITKDLDLNTSSSSLDLSFDNTISNVNTNTMITSLNKVKKCLIILKQKIKILNTYHKNEQQNKKIILFNYNLEFSSDIYKSIILFTYLFRELLYSILATYVVISLVEIQHCKK